MPGVYFTPPHILHVTLMRTSPDENAQIGAWIGERLNRCEGPVSSSCLKVACPSWTYLANRSYKEADAALFAALERTVDRPAGGGWNACRTRSTITRICSRRAASFPRRGRGGLTHAFQPSNLSRGGSMT